MNHFSGFSMKILVRNLDRLVTDAEVLVLFKAYGKVDSCVVVKDAKTGKSKGFGFIEMEDSSAGTKAIEALNGNENEGRTLRVNEAKPREERPRRQF